MLLASEFRLNKSLLVPLLGAALVYLAAPAVAQERDPGVRDTVRLVCPVNDADTGQFEFRPLPIQIWIDEPVYGFTLTFQFSAGGRIKQWQRAQVFPASWLFSQTADYFSRTFTIRAWSWSRWDPLRPGRHAIGDLIVALTGDTVVTSIDIDAVIGGPAYWSFVVDKNPHTFFTNFVSVAPSYVDCWPCDVGLGVPCEDLGAQCGDFDHSRGINIGDIVALIDYLREREPLLKDASGGDVDCSGAVDDEDAWYLARHIFSSGPPPCAHCPRD